MAIVPTPATQTAGAVVTAATVNSQGNLATYNAGRTESGGARKAVFIGRLSIAQSIASGTGNTALLLDAEDVDYDGGHQNTTTPNPPGNTRYTAQTAGYYLAFGNIEYAANATGHRSASITVNAAGLNGRIQQTLLAAPATVGSIVACAGMVQLAANDYVELQASQTSGVALNVNSARLQLIWVSV